MQKIGTNTLKCPCRVETQHGLNTGIGYIWGSVVKHLAVISHISMIRK